MKKEDVQQKVWPTVKEFLVVSVLEFREWVGTKEKEERKVKRHD